MVGTEPLPTDAKLMSLLLKSLEIEVKDDSVNLLLLHFMRSYSTKILTEALYLSEHANRQEIDLNDIVLAINLANSQNTEPPSLDVLLPIAQAKNAIDLPMVAEKYTLRCPPDRYALLEPNFSIFPDTEEDTEIKHTPDAQNITHPTNFLPYHQLRPQPQRPINRPPQQQFGRPLYPQPLMGGTRPINTMQQQLGTQQRIFMPQGFNPNGIFI